MQAGAGPAPRAKPKRARKYKPQRSYISAKLDTARQVLAQLQQTAASLEFDQEQLCSQLAAYSTGMQALDSLLYQAIAVRSSLGRQAQQLLRGQRRMQYSLASLPPPDKWDACVLAGFEQLDREHLRYMVVNAYREGSDLLRAASLGQEDAMRALDLHGEKIKRFSYSFINRKGAHQWTLLVGINLVTGEPDSVPSCWYAKAAAAVPIHTLPAGFSSYLRAGLQLYRTCMQRTVSRRHEMGQRLAALMRELPEDMQQSYRRRHMQWLGNPSPAHTTPHGNAGMPAGQLHGVGAGQTPRVRLSEAEQVEVVEELEETVQEIEDTIVSCFRHGQLLLEYVLQRLPPRIIALYAAACTPHVALTASVLEGVLALCDLEEAADRFRAAQASALSHSLQQARLTAAATEPAPQTHSSQQATLLKGRQPHLLSRSSKQASLCQPAQLGSLLQKSRQHQAGVSCAAQPQSFSQSPQQRSLCQTTQTTDTLLQSFQLAGTSLGVPPQPLSQCLHHASLCQAPQPHTLLQSAQLAGTPWDVPPQPFPQSLQQASLCQTSQPDSLFQGSEPAGTSWAAQSQSLSQKPQHASLCQTSQLNTLIPS